MRSLAVVFLVLASVGKAQVTAVDDLLAECPPAAEVALIDQDFMLTFEQDPTASEGLVCRALDGSADLTLLQRAAYQTLYVMRLIRFEKPLPWTDKTLYEWLATAIKGISFRGDVEGSFCCDPPNFIDIAVGKISYLLLDHWLNPDPTINAGLFYLAQLIVHEARHNNGFGHACDQQIPGNDMTIAEMSSWGTVYYFSEWLADHAAYPAFSADAQTKMRNFAYSLRRRHFCDTGNGIAVSPAYGKNFGEQLIGTQSGVQLAAVTATTTSPVTVSDVQIAGVNAGDFSIAKTDCRGVTLPRGGEMLPYFPIGSCTVEIAFMPSATGARAATLQVFDNAPGSPHGIALTGVGAESLVVAIGGAANSASYSPKNEVAAGGIVSVFGTNLSIGAASAQSLPLPQTLAASRITFNGIPAPLYYASPAQLNVYVPQELWGQQSVVRVIVEAPDGHVMQSAPLTISVARFGQAAIFTMNQQGTGQGAVLIAGTEMIAARAGLFPGSRPARRGEYVSV